MSQEANLNNPQHDDINIRGDESSNNEMSLEKTNPDLNNGLVEKELEEKIEKILGEDAVEPAKKAQLIRYVKAVYKSHKGPLPDPETLREYCNLITHGGDRIMAMAEAEQAHRHKIAQKLLSIKGRQITTGQWMGFIIAILFLAVGAFLIMNDHGTAGTTVLTIDLIGLVGIFVIGKYFQADKSEDSKKIDKSKDPSK